MPDRPTFVSVPRLLWVLPYLYRPAFNAGPSTVHARAWGGWEPPLSLQFGDRRTVQRLTPDRPPLPASYRMLPLAPFLVAFSRGLLCVCLLRFVKCVAFQWPTLDAIFKRVVFGIYFWFRPFTPSSR